ncbi:NAD(P)-dependent oxidoreductase [Streptomyces hokutonensis]|uniref:NAD(P)-dependent oxidoreductase n=1 Tax=Streptomyces hokutonensis TaxID=1306990 RepID=A0ABW6M5E6_9ACTN
MMKLLVLGATGATGRRFVEQALGAGHHVTAYVRNPGRIDASRLTTIAGSVDDPQALARAVAGHDAVVSMLGNGSGKTDKTLIHDSTMALITAAEQSGVKRLVLLSAFGVGESLPKASWLGKLVYKRVLGDVFADKARGEARLRESGLDWTVVYPVTLNDKEATHSIVATSLEQTPKVSGLPKVTRADVADFLLRTTENGTYMHKTVVLRPSK